jgi:hypothetical protein
MTSVIAAALAVIWLTEPARASLASNEVGADTGAERATPNGAVAMPPNIVIPGVYRPAVAAMLRYSPTFRRQCSRIALTPDLRIEVTPSLLPGLLPDEALTRIVRRPGGQIEAGVQLGTIGDPVLLIAHEFEHILEQLDGVDLASMASRTATGVHRRPGSEHFETDRAIAAGRRVAEEVQQGRHRSGT